MERSSDVSDGGDEASGVVNDEESLDVKSLEAAADVCNELSSGFWNTTRSVDAVGTMATARASLRTSDATSNV